MERFSSVHQDTNGRLSTSWDFYSSSWFQAYLHDSNKVLPSRIRVQPHFIEGGISSLILKLERASRPAGPSQLAGRLGSCSRINNRPKADFLIWPLWPLEHSRIYRPHLTLIAKRQTPRPFSSTNTTTYLQISSALPTFQLSFSSICQTKKVICQPDVQLIWAS